MENDRKNIIDIILKDIVSRKPTDKSIVFHFGVLFNIRKVKLTEHARNIFIRDEASVSLEAVFKHFSEHTAWVYDEESHQMVMHKKCLWEPGTDLKKLKDEYRKIYGLFVNYVKKIKETGLEPSSLEVDVSDVSESNEKDDTSSENNYQYSMLEAYSEIFQQNTGKLKVIARAIQFMMVLPTNTVDCERSFSFQNLIKTNLRNSLSDETFNNLLQIRINRVAPEKMDYNKCYI